MAEATEQPNVSGARYYCHQCNDEINPTLPEFTCPECSGGFIEELQDAPERPENADLPPTMPNFSEILGPGFLRNLAAHTQHSQDGSSNSSSSVDGEEERHPFMMGPMFSSVTTNRIHGGIPGAPHARISVRHVNPTATHMQIEGGNLQTVLEQLLMGLTGGGAGRTFMFGPGLTFGGLAGNPGDYVWGEGGLDAIITQLMNQLEGTGPPPASQEKIDNLPDIKVNEDHVERTVQCNVCFDDLSLGEVVKQLPCQHLYHKDCIVPWLTQHGTCPVCRKTLEGTDTTCDQNVQSIPETLQNIGINPGEQQQQQQASSSSSSSFSSSSAMGNSNSSPTDSSDSSSTSNNSTGRNTNATTSTTTTSTTTTRSNVTPSSQLRRTDYDDNLELE